ncbi:putative AAA-ATPase [Thiorhodovibrio litoralis]|nr:putative AAA-ATPase [Thiorhodovibrio litoralis]
MQRKKLPIGIQTFAKIRGEDYYYVDKTQLALRLIDEGSYYFLSRPRRFGKSLFIDTLGELFEGNEALFRGLYCHDKWDWSIRYPVIRISFAEGRLESRAQLDEKIWELLETNQHRLGIPCTRQNIPGCFGELIEQTRKHFCQRVVVLVDEYDKPILDIRQHPARLVPQ